MRDHILCISLFIYRKWNIFILLCVVSLPDIPSQAAGQRAERSIDGRKCIFVFAEYIAIATTTIRTINKNILWFMPSGTFSTFESTYSCFFMSWEIVFDLLLPLAYRHLDCGKFVDRSGAVWQWQKEKCHFWFKMFGTWHSLPDSCGLCVANVENGNGTRKARGSKWQKRNPQRHRKISPRLYFIVPEKGFK